MASAITHSDDVTSYQTAYRDFFGCEPPAVRKLSSGGYSLKMGNGDRLKWSRIELRMMTGFYRDMKDEV